VELKLDFIIASTLCAAILPPLTHHVHLHSPKLLCSPIRLATLSPTLSDTLQQTQTECLAPEVEEDQVAVVLAPQVFINHIKKDIARTIY